jgi:2-methylcitrate dehydratase PrpD
MAAVLEHPSPPDDSPAPLSNVLADFAARFGYDDIPAAIRERAKHLMLDALGTGLAATHFEFAHRAHAAALELGGRGDIPVLGFGTKLPLRDAVMLNAILMHGLDYDDTHLPGAIHATTSVFPCALGLGAHLGRSGRQLLAAYVLGVETATRLAAAAKGGFHQVGFHPTGLVGAFGCAFAAGHLYSLSAAQHATAQGIALSVASGSLEFLEDGAWTKRLHPGWAGSGGITAAALARHGFVGATRPYEGRFGLYASHLGKGAADVDLGRITRGLGTVWEIDEVAVKPYPLCHFVHALADCAIALHARGVRAEDIADIRALVPKEVVKTVCEPLDKKRRPANDYDAKFSAPYVASTALLRGRFGLDELEPAALADAQALALAQKVSYEPDPKSGFPKYYSGELVVRLKDGREVRHREEINRGAGERPIGNAEVAAKFLDNAGLVMSRDKAERIREALLALDSAPDARGLAVLVCGL